MSPSRSLFARLACAWALVLACSASHAVLLTFDELPWPPPDPLEPFPYIPVDRQYEDLGVTIEGGRLTRWPDGVPPGQMLLLGKHGAIVFTGTLPRHVSLRITSTVSDSESWAEASGPGGYWSRAGTGGWPGGEPHPIPYPEAPEPNRLVSFSSASGIARLDFFNAYNLRFSALVDNVYFGSVPAVPEPAPLVLGTAGALLLAMYRRRRAG